MAEKQENDIIPTQFLKKDFNLSEKIDEDFLNSIKEAFGDNVSAISLAFLVNDIEDESKREIISFNYRNDKEQKNNEVIIDISNPESFNKIKRIL